MVKNRDREAGVYSIHEAKTQLSRLLDRVLATGQPILIGRRGKAEVMLSPLNDAPTTRRTPGLYRSTLKLNAPLPDSLDVAQAPLLLMPQTLVRWFAAGFELPGRTYACLNDANNSVAVSTDALRQILVWHHQGQLDLGALKGRLAAACTSQGIDVISIGSDVVEKSASLGLTWTKPWPSSRDLRGHSQPPDLVHQRW